MLASLEREVFSSLRKKTEMLVVSPLHFCAIQKKLWTHFAHEPWTVALLAPPLEPALTGPGLDSVIHGFTPVGRANHYMPSLKADFIVKVDRFEVARCSSMYKITDHSFLIRFISLTIIDEVITGASKINLQSRLDYSVIHGFTPVGRANHYMSSLKADSIVKVDRFEVARCSSMYKITDHSFLIRFISLTIIDEVITGASEINLQSRLDYVVGQIRSVQGSDLTKETTRVVIRLLIDP
ncbi:hypothetical protein F2Q68_00003837 [Brassica cretica]|uniref:DUF223 domain-containing protein n=1 Tax=Brassica cretica TaxID=69181 RepID=A0A8S9JJH8_BRACR|nr:hypothetical protein F2Q68_00003837 [Brassica cretica]